MASKEKCREYYQKNKVVLLEKAREYRTKNREKTRAADNKYKKENYLKLLVGRYGLSVEQYNELLAQQKNSCLICNEVFTRTPHIDHCHTTGMVRGLLCNLCNVGLGAFRDEETYLNNAIKYLRRFIDAEKDFIG
jgi:hypothetical protein